MKKVISITVILLMVMGMFIPITYAEPIQEIEQGKVIELELDLSSVEYNTIYVIIKNNTNIKDISIAELQDSTELSQPGIEEIEGYKYILVNKAELTDNKIKLDINLINNIQVGTVINIETTTSDEITNISELQFALNSYKVVAEKSDGDNGTGHGNIDDGTGTGSNPNDGNSGNNGNGENPNGTLPDGNGSSVQDGKQGGNQSTNNFQNTNTQKSSSGFSGTSATATQTVTYNGSQNNYLSSLSVTNYSLNTEFNKTNNTYFVNVGNDVTSIEINYEENESTQTVKIYGNKNLSAGLNKVLISVTAENGNVREYRIYITKAE